MITVKIELFSALTEYIPIQHNNYEALGGEEEPSAEKCRP